MLKLRALAGLVVLGVVYIVSDLLLPSLVAVILALIAAVWVARHNQFAVLPVIGRLLDWHANAPTQLAAFNARQRIRVFGGSIDRPLFLKQVTRFYDRTYLIPAWYESMTGIQSAGIRPLVRNELNERRFLETLLASTRFEMLLRGYAVHNRLNQLIWPELRHEGFVVETIDNGDGGTSLIVATDVATPLTKQEWLKADEHGLTTHLPAWLERPLANKEVERDDLTAPSTGIMPLFRLELREIVVPALGGRDPLARKDGGVSYDIPEEWR